jgi:hypothetical protein
MAHGKKYIEAAKLIDQHKLYDPKDAVTLAKKTTVAKFDETVELHLNMGLDPRHADQQVRGVASRTDWASRSGYWSSPKEKASGSPRKTRPIS